MPAKKTVFRSLRLTEELDAAIQKEALARGLPVNSLVSQVLTKYEEWDRHAEKFGFVMITRDGFRSLIEAIPDERLARVGQELGGTNPREMTLFWFKKLGAPQFLRYLALYCRYGRIGEFEVETDDRTYTITIHHELGPKYSSYLADFFSNAVRSVVGVSAVVERSRNAIVLRFTASG
ncbi:MAG: hypothetical protein WBF81_02720 [Thermoplasmata archaeon]